MKQLMFSLIGSLLVLVACREPALEDMEAPEIQIQSPAEGASFQNGEQILLQATISENEELHTYSLTVITSGNDEVKFEVEKHEHGTDLQLSETFVPEIKLDTDFLLRIQADDHNGNSTTVERSFEVKL